MLDELNGTPPPRTITGPAVRPGDLEQPASAVASHPCSCKRSAGAAAGAGSGPSWKTGAALDTQMYRN